jgi:hypothetical protein
MNPDLDWHIDDDESSGPWSLGGRPARPRPPAPPRRTRLAWRGCLIALVPLLVFALGTAGWAAWRLRALQDQQRTAVAQLARLEDELLRKGDVDALRGLQDSSYSWFGRQLQLQVVEPAADGRPAVVAWLWSRGAANQHAILAPAEFGEVQLDADRAAISALYRYRSLAAVTPGAEPPVFTLRQTLYYRLTEEGWRRSGPPPDVWRTLVRAPGGSLRVLYPLHDAAVLEPLVPRLQAFARRACAEMGCPQGVPALIISANPEELAGLLGGSSSPEAFTAYAPAPALLGAPVDAAGQAALFRLYALRLAYVIFGGSSAAPHEWFEWESAQLGLETPLDVSVLRARARHALETGQSPLGALDDWHSGIWLALDFLAGRERYPLVGLLAKGRGQPPGSLLERAVAEDTWGWWRYLEQVAAPELGESGDVRLAVACNGQLALWNPANGTYRFTGVTAGRVLWSPDGKRLAVRATHADFNVLDLRDGSQRAGQEFPYAWAPDGRTLAVQIGADRFFWDLDGHEWEMLRPLAPLGGWVAWSPDGEHLAYASSDDDFKYGPAMLVARAGGEGAEAIAAGSQGAWSADGRYLAITTLNVFGADVDVYDVETGKLSAVIADALTMHYDLAWSPVAPQLAVASGGRVQVVAVDGSTVYEWGDAGVPFDLQWSPDGRQLGWATVPDLASQSRLQIANVAGGAVEAISRQVSAGFTLDWGWSADGRWLAYDNGGVFVRPAAGGPERVLSSCSAPAWQP